MRVSRARCRRKERMELTIVVEGEVEGQVRLDVSRVVFEEDKPLVQLGVERCEIIDCTTPSRISSPPPPKRSKELRWE